MHCSAAEHVKRGDADLMLAGGADAAIIPSGMGGFIACKALSRRNEEPERASRPWDQGRDGFVMGEGAGECHPHNALRGRHRVRFTIIAAINSRGGCCIRIIP